MRVLLSFTVYLFVYFSFVRASLPIYQLMLGRLVQFGISDFLHFTEENVTKLLP